MPTRPRRAVSAADAPAQSNPLPPIEADPEASLSAQPIEVELLGRVWTIPALPAEDWLKLLWTEPLDYDAIFPGLADADEDIIDGLLDGQITSDEVFEVAMEMIEIASGFKWWFTIKLAAQAKAGWSRIGGMLLLRGIIPSEVSLGAWCSALLALCIQNMEPSKAVEFIAELNSPPPQYAHLTQEDDGAAFLAAMRQTL